jgi:hypothetical protein
MGFFRIIQNIWLLALSCESLKCSVFHSPTPSVWPKGGTLSAAGGPCLSPSARLSPGSGSWSALLRIASVRSNEASRCVNGFGAFCRNKRASPAGAKPGNTENHVDTRVGYTSAIRLPINAFLPENPKMDSRQQQAGMPNASPFLLAIHSSLLTFHFQLFTFHLFYYLSAVSAGNVRITFVPWPSWLSMRICP